MGDWAELKKSRACAAAQLAAADAVRRAGTRFLDGPYATFEDARLALKRATTDHMAAVRAVARGG